LHVPADTAVPFAQLGWVQTAPAGYLRQLPDPLHVPSLPQLPTPSSLHVPFGSAPPAGTAAHTPWVPGSAHEKQTPLQAVLQQTPWAHTLLVHSPSFAHSAPFGFVPHEFDVQTFGAEHCVLAEQAVPQAVPLHVYGAQLCWVDAMQLPVPLHTHAGDARFAAASQLSPLQIVPAA
jgi:hypothetical protein